MGAMPNLKWNKDTWNTLYQWDLKGEEWSAAWGSSEAQWFGSIYPRIHRFVHCENILEIACGYGRWTKFLKDYPRDRYVAIDLSFECIKHCSEQFEHANIEFFENDGRSLEMVTGKQFDFVFSFDSLVHVSIDILESYITQIVERLSPSGVCFIHHSNFGALLDSGVINEGHLAFKHMRDTSTTAAGVKEVIERVSGRILCQEIIDWGGVESLDCFTLFSRHDSPLEYPAQHIENTRFMQEAHIIKTTHNAYTFRPK